MAGLERTKSFVPVVASAVKERRLVAAIDFGTTYSGYAYSMQNEFETDPLKISSNSWGSGSVVHGSHKTPTCILFNKNNIMDTFGKEAEEKYDELTLENQHWDWFFFRRFKMELYRQNLARDIKIRDIKGKEMPAIDVFSACIKYLKDHMIKSSEDKRSQRELSPNDIHWILTVPAIWDDSAKQFMREAAIHAEIHTDKLSLSLEPEAASLFCRYLPTERIDGINQLEVRCFKPGEKYVILDAGGGTVDITVHEVLENNTLRELHTANGGEWGGTKVDEKFEQLLFDVIGPDVMEVIKNNHKDDFNEIMNEFEISKRRIAPDMVQKFDVRLPQTIFEQYKELNKHDLKRSSKMDGKVSFSLDKMKIEVDVVRDLFTEVCDKITSHLTDVFSKIRQHDIQKILMVGGFSESKMLQDKVNKSFPQKRLIIPEDAGLAVLKGAVIFGHCPTMIATRVCKHTYGIRAYKHFEPALDPPSKREMKDGKVLCKDAFSTHATIGQEFYVGTTCNSHEYVPLEPGQKKMEIDIFRSDRRMPMHVDEEGSSCIGKMSVELIENTDGNDRPVVVQFVFGDTELGVEAKEKNTGKETQAKFDFLG